MSDTVTISETSQTVTLTPSVGQTVSVTTAANQSVAISTANSGYTDTNARQALSVTGAGLSYNSNTGVVTYAQANLEMSKITDAGTSATLDVGTGASQIVQMTSEGKLPGVDGSNLTNISGVTPPTLGIGDTNTVKIDSASVASGEYAKFTASGLESKTTGEVLTDIGAAAASHNQALSTITDAGGAAALNVGTIAGTVAAGDDSRLSDARTPVDHSTDKLTTGTLPVGRGGTGVTSVPMVGLITADDAAAARSVLGVGSGSGDMVGSNNLSDLTITSTARTNLGSTTVGDAVFIAADAAAARTAIGVGTGTGDMVRSNNLSDVLNAGTARNNLGLGGSAVLDVGAIVGTVAAGDDTRLSDARTPTPHNQALSTITGTGNAAALDVGTVAGTVAAGDDTRLSDARTPSSTLDHDASKITTGELVALRGGTGLTSISTLLNLNTTKADVGLSAVENTALTTWAGSGSITTVGAITGGTWGGTAIDYSALSGTPTLGTASASATGDFAAAAHNQSATTITSGQLAVAQGGTGSATAAMVGVITAVDAAAAQSVLGLGTAAVLAVGISDTNVLQANAVVADNDFLRIDGTTVEGRSAAEVLSDIGAQAADADLTAIAGLTSAADKGIQFTGSGTAGVYDLTAAGKALLDDADAAAQRTTLGVTNAGSYTGHIETGAVKEYTLDPAVVTARTITAVFIQSGNQSGSAGGTGTIILKKKESSTVSTIGTVTVSNSSGAPGSLANTSIAADGRLFLDCTANSSMTDVIFSVEYTE